MTDAASTDHEDAFAWAVRTSDPAFDDWMAFAVWVGGDPERNDAYNAAMAAVDAAELAISARFGTGAATGSRAVVVPLAEYRRQRRWLRWPLLAGGGTAAIAATVAALLVLRPDPSSMQTIETLPGQARTVALAAGSRVEMAGGSRIRFDRADPRVIALEQGQGLFTVRHDAGSPFVVNAGAHRIVDVGTTFEVVQGPAATTIAVVEGLVIVDPDAGALRLGAGESAMLRSGRQPALSRVPAGSIGQWRNARMSYRDTPITRVAADLSVALGQPIAVDAGLEARRFTGTLAPTSLRGQPGELAALLDVRVDGNAKGWTMRAR